MGQVNFSPLRLGFWIFPQVKEFWLQVHFGSKFFFKSHVVKKFQNWQWSWNVHHSENAKQNCLKLANIEIINEAREKRLTKTHATSINSSLWCENVSCKIVTKIINSMHNRVLSVMEFQSKSIYNCEFSVIWYTFRTKDKTAS